MKLLFCPHCQDVRKLHSKETTYCQCNKSYGKYINFTQAIYEGSAIPIGISNKSLVVGLEKWNLVKDTTTHGVLFDAFLIPKTSKSITIN